MAFSGEEMEQLGDYCLSINEDVCPDMVEMLFTDMDENGVHSYRAYFPPETCRKIASDLNEFADHIEGLHDEPEPPQ